MERINWTSDKVLVVIRVLKKNKGNIPGSLTEISKEIKEKVSGESLRSMLKRRDIRINVSKDVKVLKSCSYRYWTMDKIWDVVNEAAKFDSLRELTKHMSKKLKKQFSSNSVTSALKRNGLRSDFFIASRNKKDHKELLKQIKILRKKYNSEYNKNPVKNMKLTVQKSFNKIDSISDDEFVLEVVSYIKHQKRITTKRKNKITLRSLCDHFDCSPSKMESAMVSAKSQGYRLGNVNKNITIDTGIPVQRRKKVISLSRKEKNRVRLGVISDTHYGAKACLKEEIKQFVNMAYDNYGIRTILHSGDVLAGNKVYRGQEAELEVWGCSEQCQICADNLPERDGLQYIYILGNHDVDFIKSNGTDPSIILSSLRKDMKYIGAIKGNFYIDECEIEIELAHIKSNAHARSYSLEKHVYRTVSDQNRPDVIFCGHKHTNGYFEVQGLHNFLVPCFEDENYFAAYNDFNPSVGGLIVDLVLNENNEIIQCEPIFVIHRSKSKKYNSFDVKANFERIN